VEFLRRGRDPIHNDLLEHYRRVWPDREVTSVHWTPEHMATRLPDLHIAKVAPARSDEAWVFATIGAWRATEASGLGVEFVAVARSEAAAVMTHLGQLAYYHAGPAENRLGVGHTLSIGEGWVPDSPLDALLVSLPYPWGPALEHCELKGRHIQVLWAIPIHEKERVFGREHGLDALEKRFEAASLDYLDPFREAVV
jgi:Suppressor of fused protein (SUFU)